MTEEFKSVIDSFRNDEAGRLCQSDSLIILFGKRLWAKSIKEKEKHVVTSEMRVLANLILRMRVVSLNDNLCAQNILEREHFDTLCDSIRHLTTRENGGIKASLKLKIGYVLKKLIKTSKGHDIQANEMEKSVEVDRYSAVLDLNGDYYIFYTAQDMCEERRNTLRKPQAMPVEEDVSKLRAFILNEIHKLSDDERMK